MTDYRIKSIHEELGNASDALYVISQCADVTNTLRELEASEVVREYFTTDKIKELHEHFTMIERDIAQIAYNANYACQSSIDNADFEVGKIDSD